MSVYEQWDRRTTELLEEAYLDGGAGPRGSGSGSADEGLWRAKRQHLTVPMDGDGHWLDVGCANGHLMATLPRWAAESGVDIVAHGLELIPSVAELARRLHPVLADRIHTGSVMTWNPPRRYDYVTVLDDAVPADRLGVLIERCLTVLVEPGGRLVVSSYTDRGAEPRPLVDNVRAAGRETDGVIHIDRPGRAPLQTVWLDPPAHPITG